MPRPRPDKPRVQRPSPLKQVHDEKSLAEIEPPAAGLIRDPYFWKRFSTAVHMSELGDVSVNSSASSIDLKYGLVSPSDMRILSKLMMLMPQR